VGPQAGFSTDDFHLGATVYTSDGREVGELRRVLVDGKDFELKAVVVKEGRAFSGHLLSPGSMMLVDELVVPAGGVRQVAHDRIDLGLSTAQARRLHPYLTYATETETPSEELADVVSVLGSSPAIPQSIHEIAHKPASELEIEGGENVMLGQTGKRLGSVRDVLFDDDELVAVVISPGWFQQEVILPRRFLERSDDAALFVDLTEDEIAKLKPFRPRG
jgi:sporulation protein YlmC with PRC-barrel domain